MPEGSFALFVTNNNNPLVSLQLTDRFAQFPESLSLSRDGTVIGNYRNSSAGIGSNTLGIQAHRITIDGSPHHAFIETRIHPDTRAFIETLALVFSYVIIRNLIRNYAMLRYISIIINSIVTMLLAREHIYIYIYIFVYIIYI